MITIVSNGSRDGRDLNVKFVGLAKSSERDRSKPDFWPKYSRNEGEWTSLPANIMCIRESITTL